MGGYVTCHNKYKLITYTVNGESMLIARVEPDSHQYFFYETEEAAIKQCVENNLTGWARANRFLTILTRAISAYEGDLKWHTNQP